MKRLLLLIFFVSFFSFGQDDDMIYLTFRKTTDTINLYCVNKNPADYFIYLHMTNRDFQANPNKLKQIVKANDSAFVTLLTSKFKLEGFEKDIIFYKKALIEVDSAQAFKDFKTPTEKFIAKDQVIVFTKKICPDCSEITNFLNQEKLPSKQIDIQQYTHIKQYEEVIDYFELNIKKVELPLVIFEGKPYYNLKKKERKILLDEILEKLKHKRYQNTKRRYQ